MKAMQSSHFPEHQKAVRRHAHLEASADDRNRRAEIAYVATTVSRRVAVEHFVPQPPVQARGIAVNHVAIEVRTIREAGDHEQLVRARAPHEGDHPTSRVHVQDVDLLATGGWTSPSELNRF